MLEQDHCRALLSQRQCITLTVRPQRMQVVPFERMPLMWSFIGRLDGVARSHLTAE